MDEPLAAVSDAIATLTTRLEALEARVATVEAGAAGAAASASLAGPAPVAPTAVPERFGASSQAVTLLSSAGRSLIVLGGAYLLRALTEGGALPPAAGSAIALAYAAAWLVAAGRAAQGGRQADAAAHGLTASLIGFPLIWEATVRFGFLGAPSSAAGLAIFTGVALAVAWRTRQRPLAWIVTLATLATTAVLVPQTGAPLPYAALLVALGTATLWFGYVHDWTVLRWPVAIAADLAALGLVARGLSPARPEAPSAVQALLLALVAAYLASTAIRTLVRGRNVVPFEILQGGVALVIGLWGSIAVARAAGGPTAPFGVGVLALGASSYAVAFAFVDRRQGRGRNFYFYTSLALVLTLAGASQSIGGNALPVAATALGVASGLLGVRFGRLALGLHAAIYMAVASMSSGLVGTSLATLAGRATGEIPGTAALVAMAGLAVAVGLPLRCQSDEASGWARPHRIVMLALFLCGLGGAAVSAGCLTIATVLGREVAPAEAATVRTVVIAAAAVALAFASRQWDRPEAGWLTYPVLLAGGVKVLQDLRSLPAALLVVSLAIFGASLIVAPRALRWKRNGVPGEPGTPLVERRTTGPAA